MQSGVIEKPETIRDWRRGRGLILKDDKILLCNRIGTDYLYLPGGKAQFREFAITALCRELGEELGLYPVVNEFVGVFEHEFFDVRRNVHVQEVNFIFTLSFSDVLPEAVESRERHLKFKWIKVAEMDHNFYPSSLVPFLSAWLKEKKAFYGKSH